MARSISLKVALALAACVGTWMAKPVAAEAQSDISGFHGDARAAVYQNSAVGKAGKHRAGKPRSQPSPPPADVTRAGSSQNDGPYPADPMAAYK